MSFTDDLLVVLSSYSGGYRLMRARMRGDMRQFRGDVPNRSAERASDATMRVTLSRLKKRGLIENRKGEWKITKWGRKYLADKRVFPNHAEKTAAHTQKNIIISFDIPEKQRKERHWLRTELVILGFIMLQKSVWFGPSPLPDAFVESLKNLKILPHIKFFEAKESDII